MAKDMRDRQLAAHVPRRARIAKRFFGYPLGSPPLLLEIQEFRQRVATDLWRLIEELQQETGRFGVAEQDAWAASLTRTADVLGSPKLSRFHVHVGERGGLSLEYRLPASASYCDVVLLGRSDTRPAAVILELKDWYPGAAAPGPTAALVRYHGDLALHPAEQVRGYTDYCRSFHSAVVEEQADVQGCVFLTRTADTNGLDGAPHDGLVREFPIFVDRDEHVQQQFPDFVLRHIERPDQRFATAFESGTYRQDRSFCTAVANLVVSGESPFVLLDHQRLALEVCRHRTFEALSTGNKTVLVIEGPPGSGKSAVAAHLWAALRRDPRLDENACVITTTSAAQRTNWRRFMERAARGAAGIVLPAAQYSPADTRWVGAYRKRHGKSAMQPSRWRENVEICRSERGHLAPAAPPLVSIVDEAHALINPEDRYARTPAGFPVAFGPQAWHIIRASRVSVFLMDRAQGYRDRENTSADDIEKWATEQGAVVAPRISLAGAQFRAAGSVEYSDWIDFLLGQKPEPPRKKWRAREGQVAGKVQFELAADPFELEAFLRGRVREGRSARLVASYARPWVTDPGKSGGRRAVMPHRLPPEQQDFCISVRHQGAERHWHRIWNYIPGADYTLFVQGPAGSPIAEDSLAEVGCPYVVRGFDFDWIGLLWLSDLVWRNGEWRVLPEHVHESGIAATLRRARGPRDPGKPDVHTELLRRVQQAYRILLTRPMTGIIVWFEDPETRLHVEGLLRSA